MKFRVRFLMGKKRKLRNIPLIKRLSAFLFLMLIDPRFNYYRQIRRSMHSPCTFLEQCCTRMDFFHRPGWLWVRAGPGSSIRCKRKLFTKVTRVTRHDINCVSPGSCVKYDEYPLFLCPHLKNIILFKILFKINIIFIKVIKS